MKTEDYSSKILSDVAIHRSQDLRRWNILSCFVGKVAPIQGNKWTEWLEQTTLKHGIDKDMKQNIVVNKWSRGLSEYWLASFA